MNPKNVNVRMDRTTGEFWLTEERKYQPVRKVANITSGVLLSMCADLFEGDGHQKVERDVKFSDGSSVRITIEEIVPPIEQTN